MSFKSEYGCGGGKKDLSISEGAYQKLNSYARILKIEENTATIDTGNIIEGDFKFQAGEIALLHISATNRETADFLGKYLIAKITLVASDGVITFDKNIAEFFDGVNLDYEYMQAVIFAQLSCLKLKKDAVLTPPVFNPYHFTGGILAIMCYDDFVFEGGNIDLTDCGIPANRKNALRPLRTQETAANGETDFSEMAGQENFITADRFLLNAGDGAAFIIAKNLICNEDSRIGNPQTHGVARSRGAKDSKVKTSNITNIGGSTILIAAEKIQNFTPKIIAKYRRADLPEGKGLCRCYIASDTKLPFDEKLYAYDILSDAARVRSLGIENFGNGNFGDVVNPAAQLNNYAKVVYIGQGGYRFRVTEKTISGLAPFKVNSLVMALATQKTDKYTVDAGKFVLGRVVAIVRGSVILDKNLKVDLENYSVQLIAIPEYNNLTINSEYKKTPKFDGAKGGICAVAVADTFNLTGGKIKVEGGACSYEIGNAQMSDRLPIGAVFILSKNLILNENSRLGENIFVVADTVQNFNQANIEGGFSFIYVNNPQ